MTGAIWARLSRHQPSGPRAHGWRLGATLAVIVLHHLGYRGFQDRAGRWAR